MFNPFRSYYTDTNILQLNNLKKQSMKKSFILALLSMFSFAHAQTTVDTIRTDITTNTTWNSGTIYLLEGNRFVKNGATLTIEPGTIIRGDKA